MKLKLKKGLKLNIAGSVAPDAKIEDVAVTSVAICPEDYPGFVPKVCVHEGDSVSIGTALLFDKVHTDIKLVSPIAGTVRAVVRGERRKILRIEIAAGPKEATNPSPMKVNDGTAARRLLAENGFLALMRQRPYDIVPSPEGEVRNIFVTAIDTAPLAASASMVQPFFDKADYEAAVNILNMVTSGKVYISHPAGWQLGDIKGAEMVEVSGPHPAGNAGVQAANISPVNKGEIIWTLDLPTLGRIGKYVRTGEWEWRTVVTIAGPEVNTPGLSATLVGAPVENLLASHMKPASHHRRIISGNVLTGTAIGNDGYLRYPYRQITVIAEGDDRDEFMGWASLSPDKMSESASFPGHFRKAPFVPDARLNGGRRAMIMSGQYEQYIPMDILPEYLLKAIHARDIEAMERLGIYEVAPEDFAAAEYADTSKIPLQSIVREGLDYIRKELE
ncbi:MAG: NADH:ubiquinone reductase (Na(+)-transporting) subunit A [Muribaculaceae bacterium]|nr:NADH:ubiquinone reductase (Na(+)-transporting) subunit A [Muribaculaceae bacterium]